MHTSPKLHEQRLMTEELCNELDYVLYISSHALILVPNGGTYEVQTADTRTKICFLFPESVTDEMDRAMGREIYIVQDNNHHNTFLELHELSRFILDAWREVVLKNFKEKEEEEFVPVEFTAYDNEFRSIKDSYIILSQNALEAVIKKESAEWFSFQNQDQAKRNMRWLYAVTALNAPDDLSTNEITMHNAVTYRMGRVTEPLKDDMRDDEWAVEAFEA